MRILGTGIDIIEIKRIRKVIAGNKTFLNRVFTAGEIAYCESKTNKYQHYAVRFAAKEAILKAFGTGMSAGMKWTDIEVLRGAGGGPIVNISGAARDLADLRGVKQVLLSYSHDEGYAVAHAVLIGGARFGAKELHHEA